MSLLTIRVRSHLAVLVLALVVSGCGGGDGDSSSSGAGQGNTPPSTPPTTSNAPTIQGQPGSSVLASQSYSFLPSASDPNGDTLTFSASNLPAWATLDSSTGRVSGTPTSADIGTYSGITVTVSDGNANASLGPFSISVTDVASGAATLSWVPPALNSDGSALTDLAGYQIRYGTNPDDLSQVVSLTNPSLSIYMVENLTSGTWYFAVAAVNTGGVASDLSNLASKTIG